MSSQANLSDSVSQLGVVKGVKYTAVYCSGVNEASEQHDKTGSKRKYKQNDHINTFLSIGNPRISA